MKLSDLIVEYRRKMGISQREFSRKCDLSNTYISFLENENNPKTGKPIVPTLEQYKKLADGMGITVQRLFEMLDEDSPVDLHTSASVPSEEPANDDVRILVGWLNKMSPEQVEQAKTVFRAVFSNHPELFEKGDDDQ